MANRASCSHSGTFEAWLLALIVAGFVALLALGAPASGLSTGFVRPFCVGVAGGTASGKSSVVSEVVRLLSHERVASITQDCFYRALTPEQHEAAMASDYNFDHPGAFDFNEQLEMLLEDGWWEMKLEEIFVSTTARNEAVPHVSYAVSSVQYDKSHEVDAESLRPLWRWAPAGEATGARWVYELDQGDGEAAASK